MLLQKSRSARRDGFLPVKVRLSCDFATLSCKCIRRRYVNVFLSDVTEEVLAGLRTPARIHFSHVRACFRTLPARTGQCTVGTVVMARSHGEVAPEKYSRRA